MENQQHQKERETVYRPVIAAIDGPCIGAGMEFVAACDIRIASTRAVFGMPETKLGIPSVIEAALLPRLLGWGRLEAMEQSSPAWGRRCPQRASDPRKPRPEVHKPEGSESFAWIL